jgi:hypothetical protein
MASRLAAMHGAAVAAPGSIGGHVRDDTGQPLPGVSVTIVPERGGPARQTLTDGAGVHRVDGLADGTYRIDFQLRGFDLTRHNRVQVRQDTHVQVDASLSISAICECITSGLATAPQPVAGQVVDEADRPRSNARVEVVTPSRRETTYTDRNGRFSIRTPVKGTWPLTASDGGFRSATLDISAVTAGPIVLKLRYVGTATLPNIERVRLGCLCPEYFSQGVR